MFKMVSWHESPSFGTARNKGDVLRTRNDAQKATNSTRGSTPGLKDPSRGEQGGRVPLPNPSGPVRKPVVPRTAGPSRASRNSSNQQSNPLATSTGIRWFGGLKFGTPA